jgi:clan AA aspartic protease
MICGAVNDRNEIRIPLPVLDGAGYEQVVDAILDTGFDGWLALPNALISSLQLSRVAELPVRFGDGRVELIDHYEATVVWEGVERLAEVRALDGDILIGMALLSGHDLRVRVAVGGVVEIEAIPRRKVTTPGWHSLPNPTRSKSRSGPNRAGTSSRITTTRA